MLTEASILRIAGAALRTVTHALANVASKSRRRKFISAAVAELLKFSPDLDAAEASLRAAEATGVTPEPELLRAQAMLSNARTHKKTSAKKRTTRKKTTGKRPSRKASIRCGTKPPPKRKK